MGVLNFSLSISRSISRCLSDVTTTIDGTTYFEGTTYDAVGRVYQVFDAAGNGSYTDLGVVQYYNAYGYLEIVGDAVEISGSPRKIYRKIVGMNARGQVTVEQLGDNVVSTVYDYYEDSGLMRGIDSTNVNTTSADYGYDVQDLNYSWDAVGNLSSRQEQSGSKNLSDSYFYDGLNRLTTQIGVQNTKTVTYDSIGNIKNKSDVGSSDYVYGAGTAGPHAVTSAGGATYGYDLNGNNKTGDGRTIDYTTSNKPSQITKGGHTTQFVYGPDRARYKRTDIDSLGTTVTRYVGNVEIISRPDGTNERKRYIAGIAIETVYFGPNTVEDSRVTLYQFRDHLGSVDVITNDQGEIVQEMSFDAWGQRRNATNWLAFNAAELATFDHSITTRGFTGHEMLDEVGIIHMNGRIYDAKLGRFLQADPLIQELTNTQSLNRYSYVWNNPLNATDPTGYISLRNFVGTIVGSLLTLACGPNCGFWAYTFIGGYSGSVQAFASGGDPLKGFGLGAISGAAFSAVGASDAFGYSPGEGLGRLTSNALANGVVGGITNVLSGGKFGSGFAAAGLSAFAKPGIRKTFGTEPSGLPARVIARAVIGGTISDLSGGKFSNGAITAAFSQLFNEEPTLVREHETRLLDLGVCAVGTAI